MTTSLHMHNVVKLEVEQDYFGPDASSVPFWRLNIVAIDAEGRRTEFKLFSDQRLEIPAAVEMAAGSVAETIPQEKGRR